MKWPADTRESQKVHALKHVQSVEYAISVCKRRRTAVQAGGNVGLWPVRLAKSFAAVVTFEPEPISRACLEENVAGLANVTVRPEALGEKITGCGIERRSLGSHVIVADTYQDRDRWNAQMIDLDTLEIEDADLLQLDIEGYEIHALSGAVETIRRSRPVIQVEILGLVAYDPIFDFMRAETYRLSKDMGRDFVFCPE